MKLGATQRKAFIIVFGIIAILALSYILIAQKLDGNTFADNIETKKRAHSSQLEIIENEGPYVAKLQQYQERLEENRARLLKGDNPNVAESNLLKILSDYAERNGVEITQQTTQKEENIEDKLYKVSVRIVTRCNSEQLVQLLTDIRNHNRFLTIDQLTISTRSTRGRPSSEMPTTLIVSGYISAAETMTEENGQNASS